MKFIQSITKNSIDFVRYSEASHDLWKKEPAYMEEVARQKINNHINKRKSYPTKEYKSMTNNLKILFFIMVAFSMNGTFVSCTKAPERNISIEMCTEDEIFKQIEAMQKDYYDSKIGTGLIQLFNVDSMDAIVHERNEALYQAGKDSMMTKEESDRIKAGIVAIKPKSRYQDPYSYGIVDMYLKRIIETTNYLYNTQDTAMPKFAVLYSNVLNAGTVRVCNEDVILVHQPIFDIPDFVTRLMLDPIPAELLSDVRKGKIVSKREVEKYIFTDLIKMRFVNAFREFFDGNIIPDYGNYPNDAKDFYGTINTSQVMFAIAHEYAHHYLKHNSDTNKRKSEFIKTKQDTALAKQDLLNNWRREYDADFMANNIILQLRLPKYQPDYLAFSMGGILYLTNQKFISRIQALYEHRPVAANADVVTNSDSTFHELFQSITRPGNPMNYENIKNDWLRSYHPPLTFRQFCTAQGLLLKINWLKTNNKITPVELAHYEFVASLLDVLQDLYLYAVEYFSKKENKKQ